MLGAALGIAIVAVLVMVALACLSVLRQLLRLKKRAGEMGDNQLFVAVAAAQSDFKSLDASAAAFSAQAGALKDATARIRESARHLANVRQNLGLGVFASQLRELIDVLR